MKITKKKCIKTLRASNLSERQIQQIVNKVKSFNGQITYYDTLLWFITGYAINRNFNQTLYYIETRFNGEW